jgi:hypothetical protein
MMGGMSGGCAVYFLLFLFLLTVIATNTECQGNREVSASRCIPGLLPLLLSLICHRRHRHCFSLFPLPSPLPLLCPLPSPSLPPPFLPLDLLVDCLMAPHHCCCHYWLCCRHCPRPHQCHCYPQPPSPPPPPPPPLPPLPTTAAVATATVVLATATVLDTALSTVLATNLATTLATALPNAAITTTALALATATAPPATFHAESAAGVLLIACRD